jgi:hypothetical protein
MTVKIIDIKHTNLKNINLDSFLWDIEKFIEKNSIIWCAESYNPDSYREAYQKVIPNLYLENYRRIDANFGKEHNNNELRYAVKGWNKHNSCFDWKYDLILTVNKEDAEEGNKPTLRLVVENAGWRNDSDIILNDWLSFRAISLVVDSVEDFLESKRKELGI